MACDEQLVNRIRAGFQHQGLTQKELADRLGVSQPTISKVLRLGTSRPEHLSRLAEVFQVPVGWLTTGNPDSAPEWFSSATAKDEANPGSEATASFVHALTALQVPPPAGADEDQPPPAEDRSEQPSGQEESESEPDSAESGLTRSQLAVLIGLPLPR